MLRKPGVGVEAVVILADLDGASFLSRSVFFFSRVSRPGAHFHVLWRTLSKSKDSGAN